MELNSSIIEHIPVLGKKLTEQIKLPQDAVMVDATIGQGGHSLLFGQMMGPKGIILGLDVDEKTLQGAQLKLSSLACKVIMFCSNFSRINEHTQRLGIDNVDFILADLGVSSQQLADSGVGLSFQINMPLDMRLDKSLKTSAADIINELDERSLAELIYKFGEEKASRRIARLIVQYRQTRLIKTTAQLAAIVCRAVGQPGKNRKNRIHPATKTFQALRIAVNRELENLETLLRQAPEILKKNGYIAIISFHSLEDRIVKNNFRQNGRDNIYRIITKKPIVAAHEEISSNRRARSAKLRIAQKIND